MNNGIDGVLVEVDDLDAHLAHARAAGARILSEIEDAGGFRHYRAEDLEGHRWMFSGAVAGLARSPAGLVSRP